MLKDFIFWNRVPHSKKKKEEIPRESAFFISRLNAKNEEWNRLLESGTCGMDS